MEINEFAKPYVPDKEYSKHQIGSQFNSFEIGKKWKNSIIICGISNLNGETGFLNRFRDTFYSLRVISQNEKFVDLGNIISLSKKDREEALNVILKEAKRLGAILLLFGADDDFLDQIPRNKAKRINQCITVNPFTSENNLAVLANKNDSVAYIGVQSYFNLQDGSLKEKIAECITLGQLRDDIMDVEPFFRMANRVNFNLTAIRKSDYSLSYLDSPNGLYAEEICQLGWFAGNSDDVDIYTLTNLNDENDCQSDKMMSAQLCWYILTGIAMRYNENPSKNTRNFKEYYIENNKIPEDLVFYKSMKSEKFWVKYGQDDFYIPCSKRDMNVVLEGNLPDRLMKKITVSQKKQ